MIPLAAAFVQRVFDKNSGINKLLVGSRPIDYNSNTDIPMQNMPEGGLSMIKLQINLIWQGCAQGRYSVKAKGFILAVLRWGNTEAPLPDWTPFAYVPIDPSGNGSFVFSGGRGIPAAATHVWARLMSSPV